MVTNVSEPRIASIFRVRHLRRENLKTHVFFNALTALETLLENFPQKGLARCKASAYTGQHNTEKRDMHIAHPEEK
jgi:hypothetical protein